MQKITSTIELSKAYPEAFAALPECYQSDDVLEYIIQSNALFAQAKESEIGLIGNNVWCYYQLLTHGVWDISPGLERF